MGSFFSKFGSLVFIWIPRIVRHPYKKGPTRGPNLENHPYVSVS